MISSCAELASAVRRFILVYERENGGPIKRTRLAKMVGVSASSLYAYLNGATLPPSDTFDRLMDVLHIPDADRLRLVSARDDLAVAGRTREPRPAAEAWPAAYRQLPMDIAEFTGRAAELHCLKALVESTSAAGTAPVVAVIEGMAGVGKTRLAVRAAHQIAANGRFDEIQLWVDLHGFDPALPPADPSSVLAMFLRMLGVPHDQVPHDLEARAAVYRDRLHSRRALVLLDNATNESQVRPLLPASPTCLILITSRRGLPGLDGAQPLRLESLPTSEAVELLGRVAGHDRVEAKPASAVRIAELCGHLPIAVTVAARLLQARPTWTMADLAERLAADDRRLTKLVVGDRDVRVAFDLSYRALPPHLQQLFRLLGLHPGDDFTSWSVAALINTTSDEAERGLDKLLDDHLLQQATPGRYRFHDLLRTYARERAHTDGSAAECRTATRRLLDWYLHAAGTAGRVIAPSREHSPLPKFDGPSPPAFGTPTEALEWCRSEHSNLMAASAVAADQGMDDLAWRIPVVLKAYLEHAKPWDAWLALGDIAVAAARRTGERFGEARALNILGQACWELRRFDESIESQQRALAIHREIGQRNAEGMCLNNIGVCYQEAGEAERAIPYYVQALEIARESDDLDTQGVTLASLGEAHYRLGRLREATDYFTQALAILREAGNRYQESFTLTYLAHTYASLGLWNIACAHYREALTIHRAMRNRYGEAETLIGLATISDHHDRIAEANGHRQRARTILDELNAPTDDRLRNRLTDAC